MTTVDPASQPPSLRELLKAGAEIYEYNRSMIHAKVLVVDEPMVRVRIDKPGSPFVQHQ